MHQNGILASMFDDICRLYCLLNPNFGLFFGVFYNFDYSILQIFLILLHSIALFAVHLHTIVQIREVNPYLQSNQMSHLSILMS